MSSVKPGGGSFVRDGEALLPQPWTKSGWGPNMLMGRYLAGLIAYGAEQHATPEFQPGRMTVDMFRPAPLGPTLLDTRVVRDGRRIRVVDVDVIVAEEVVCRGSVVFLLRTADPETIGWVPAEHELPDPESRPTYVGQNGWTPVWDQRPFGTWGATAAGERGSWQRETEDFVAGDPVSPFMRVALAADSANGGINAHEKGLNFINADLTLTLAALPQDEWVAMRPISRAVADGVSVGVVDVYDRTHRIGQVSMIGLADKRNG